MSTPLEEQSKVERDLDPRVTLAVLRQLVELQEYGSLGAVARHLGLSQPTISANMTRLEQALGLPLLMRGPRGATLTHDGVVVAAAARVLLQETKRFAGAIAELSVLPEPSMRLAASLTIAEQLVPRWLADRSVFRRAPKGSSVNVSVGNSEEVMEWVLTGQADLGFVEGNRVRRGLSHASVGRDELVAVVAPQHRWTGRQTEIDPEELLRGGLVVREQGSGTLEVLVHALARVGASIPAGLPSFGSTSSILTAVRHGGAVAVVSALAVEGDLAEGKLVAVRVAGLDLTRTLTAVWNPAAVQRRDTAELITNLVRRHSAKSAADR